MAAKPTKYPDWSVKVDGTDNDVVDVTTGENNVVEPTAGKKLLGWIYNEKPPRQYFNWLARLATQWIRWFDQEVTANDVDIADSHGNINTAVSNAGLTPDITDNTLLGQAIALSGVALNYISGLYIGVPILGTTTVDIGPGIAKSKDGAATIVLSATLNKVATSNWVAGDGNGGFPSGLTLTNNTYYHVFVIKNPTTGAVDAGFDTSIDASNLLSDASGFTKYRRVGTLLWLSTDFDRVSRVINSDIYNLDTRRSQTLNLSAIAGSYLATTKIGPEMNCLFLVGSSAPTYNGIYGTIVDGGNTGATPPVATEDLHDVGSNSSGVKTSVPRKMVINSITGNNGQIVYNFNSSAPSGTVTAYFYGWIDKRDDI